MTAQRRAAHPRARIAQVSPGGPFEPRESSAATGCSTALRGGQCSERPARRRRQPSRLGAGRRRLRVGVAPFLAADLHLLEVVPVAVDLPNDVEAGSREGSLGPEIPGQRVEVYTPEPAV